MAAFTVNGQRQEVGVDGDTPLLWVLREHLKLTGTKFGCGVAACGACTVMWTATHPLLHHAGVDGGGLSVTTIEGSPDGSHPCRRLDRRAGAAMRLLQSGRSCRRQRCWRATSRLRARDRRAHGRHLCRCGTYLRIISAIQRAAREGEP